MSSKKLKSSAKIETVFELIDELPQDMQREVFTKLMSFNPSNYKNLPLINKKFADYYSRTRRLSKISPKNLTIEKLPEITDKVVNVIGDLKIEKLLKYQPVVEELDNVVKNSNYRNLYDKDEFSYLTAYETLAEAKRHYEDDDENDDEYVKPNFNKITKDYNDIWNFQNIILYDNYPERIKYFQSRIKGQRNRISKYDPKNVDADNKKIDSFLKIDPENITYAKCVKALQNLPLSVKTLDL